MGGGGGGGGCGGWGGGAVEVRGVVVLGRGVEMRGVRGSGDEKARGRV